MLHYENIMYTILNTIILQNGSPKTLFFGIRYCKKQLIIFNKVPDLAPDLMQAFQRLLLNNGVTYSGLDMQTVRICRNYANVTAPLLIWMFIKNSNFFDSNTHSTDLPTPTKNSCHFCFPQLHLKLGKRGKEKYACRGELLSQQWI